jgi:hypothetical protein
LFPIVFNNGKKQLERVRRQRSQIRTAVIFRGANHAHFDESEPDTDERKIDPLTAKRKNPFLHRQLHKNQRWATRHEE